MSNETTLRFKGYSLPEGSVDIQRLGHGFRTNRHTSTFTGFDERLLPKIKAIEAGGYLLLQDQFSDVSTSRLVGRFQELSEKEEDNQLANSRRRNTHGLQFGQITLQSEKDKEKAALVAIKPFFAPKDALLEFAATNYVNAFTKKNKPVQGLTPAGFYRYEDGTVGLITNYEHEIVSYDNTFWDAEKEPTPEQVEKAMGKIALALGKIHLMGITHGDAQVKNFAVDNKGIRIIDLESANGFPIVGHEFNPDLVASRVSEDIDKLINSFNTGLESQSDYRDYREAITDWFIPKYISVVSLPHSKVPQKAQLKPVQVKKLVEQSVS